ncbi:MAG: hypothetical protein AAGE80_10335 [Pseudomonadota bacterium]
MISHFLYAAISSAFAAFVALFLIINAGLRMFPAGKRFLAEARSRGQLTAPYRWSMPLSVHAVFMLAGVAAVLAGLVTWIAIRSGLH